MGIPGYIAELLDEHDYVIIPGFGAFGSVYRSAQVDPSHEIVLPPSRNIDFRAELKMDDGILAGYIAHRKKVAATQAHRMLEYFTDDLRYRLSQGEAVSLEPIGTLSLEDDLYHFKPSADSEMLPDAFGLGPVPCLATASDEDDITHEHIRKPKISLSIKKKQAAYLALPIVAVIFLSIYFAFFHSQGSTDSGVALTNSHPEIVSEQQSAELLPDTTGLPGQTTEPESRGSLQAGISATGNTDPKTNISPSEVPDGQPKAEKTTSAQTSGTQPSRPDKKMYYLIGGSFKSQEYADEYFVKMTAEGRQPLHLGKIGAYYLVALGAYQSEKEAYDASGAYKNDHPGADLYVYHPR